MSGAETETAPRRLYPIEGMDLSRQKEIAIRGAEIARDLVTDDDFQLEWGKSLAALDPDTLDPFLFNSVAVRLIAEMVDQAIAVTKAAPAAADAEPDPLTERFVLDTHQDRDHWLLSDAEDGFEPVVVPRSMAKTHAEAAKIALWMDRLETAAYRRGIKHGYADAQADFRRMIGAEAAT